MKKKIVLSLLVLVSLFTITGCEDKKDNKLDEPNVRYPDQHSNNPTPTPDDNTLEPTVEPMKEFVLGGSIPWEDEEIIKNTMAQYKGSYQNSDSKRLYIDGSDFTYYVRPPKIGGFEGDMEVHTFNDGDDVFTNKFLVEVDSRLTIECEGRAGHYAEGVVITFVFEDGTVTVTCGDETMTFTQSDKQ